MNKEFVIVVIVMILIWSSLLFYFIHYAEEVKNNPCSICANKSGTNVYCTTNSFVPQTKTFYPNWSIENP